MSTLIKRNHKWFYTHKEYIAGNDGFPGMVQQFAGASDKLPMDWLLCDGAEYNVADYPDLYDVIGNIYGGTTGSTFNVPDYRECALVGAGQNGTDEVGAHDEYNVGEFKNDQIQQITGFYSSSLRTYAYGGCEQSYSGTGCNYDGGNLSGGSNMYSYFNTAYVARSGTTTHGKQKGINYIIHV